MHVLGFVDAELVNQYYKIAQAMISKPGGATTAEILTVELPIIMYDLNSQAEDYNKVYLLESNIGKFAQTIEDIPVYLDQLLAKMPQLATSHKLVDWREKLLGYLGEIAQGQSSKIDF